MGQEAELTDPEALADQLALVFDGAIAQAQMRDPEQVALAALAAATALVSAASKLRRG